MIGDGPLKKQCEEMSLKLGIGAHVKFMGHQPWCRVQEEYLNAKYFVFPSLRESFGSQILEAAAKGLPVITFASSEAANWISVSAGRFVNLTDRKNLDKAIGEEIIDSLEVEDWVWEEMSLNCVKFASQHSIPKVANFLNEIYNEATRN
jgi:glycosyltransferase involved in cell wall biosynthesis